MAAKRAMPYDATSTKACGTRNPSSTLGKGPPSYDTTRPTASSGFSCLSVIGEWPIFAAFETFEHVSNRREAAVADRLG